MIFPLLAAVAYSVYSVSVKLSSAHVTNQIFAAMMISFFSVLWGGIIFLGTSSHITAKSVDAWGVGLLCAAGFGALVTEYFVFQAYARGVPLNVIQPITFGGGIALSVLVSLLMGEPMTPMKVLGIVAIVAGMSVLLRAG